MRTARALLASRRSAEAINLLRRGLRLEPVAVDAALLLAKALIVKRRFAEAAEALRQFLRRSDDLRAFQLYIRLCLALEDAPRAVHAARQALVRYPGDRRLAQLQRQALSRFEPEDDPTEIDDATPWFCNALSAAAAAAARNGKTTATRFPEHEVPTPDVVQLSEDTPHAEELSDPTPADAPRGNVLFGDALRGNAAHSDPPPAEALPGDALTVPSAPDAELDPLRPDPTPRDPAPPPGCDRMPAELDAPTPEAAIAEEEEPEEAPTRRYGPLLGRGAPDLIKAVERFLAATNSTKQPLFGSLVGEGPAEPAPKHLREPDRSITPPPPPADAFDDSGLFADSAELVDSEELVPTPPARWPALHAPRFRAARDREDAVLDAPTPSVILRLTNLPQVDGRTPEAEGRPHAPSLPPSLAPAGATTPAVEAPAAPAGRRARAARRPRRITEIGKRSSVVTARSRIAPPIDPLRDSAVPHPVWPLHLYHAARSARREQPARPHPVLYVVVALVIVAVAAATTVGLLRRSQAQESLLQAHALAGAHQARQLKAALYRAKAAATLGGRRADVIALAAAIHARLVVEFGESDLGAAQTLVAESRRLGAAGDPRAAAHLALAESLIAVGRDPLAKATRGVRRTLARYPEDPALTRLYAGLLIRQGALAEAAQLLHAAPADASVLHGLAELAARRGKLGEARTFLRAAARVGMSAEQATIALAALDLDARRRPRWRIADVERFQRLAEDTAALSAAERAWAQLLVAAAQADSDTDAAEAALQRALRVRPLTDARFWHHAARLAERFGKLDRALECASTAHRIAPGDQRLLTHEAALHVTMDRADLAIAQLGKLARPGPEARFVLANAHLRQGRPAAAHAAVQPLHPDDPLRRLAEARALVAEGRPRDALQHLSALGPTDAAAALVRGLAALAAGDHGHAAAAFEVTLAEQPRQAEALWGMGQVALARQRGAEARALLQAAATANPHRLRYHIDLGRLLARSGDFAAARPFFLAALALNPNDLGALGGRALTAVELNHEEVAADLFALKASGHRNMAQLLSARRWMRLDRWDLAASELAIVDRAWLAEEPTGQLWAAQLALARGKQAAAYAGFRRSLRDPETRAAAQVGLSQLALAAGELATAIDHARQARRSAERTIVPPALRIEAWLQLARCLERAEAFDEAIRELRALLEHDKSNFEANLMLGRISAELKERDAALKHVQAALRVKQHSRSARELLTRLCREDGTSPACQ